MHSSVDENKREGHYSLLNLRRYYARIIALLALKNLFRHKLKFNVIIISTFMNPISRE